MFATLRAIFHRAKHRAGKDAETGTFTYGEYFLTFKQIADQTPGRHRLRVQTA